MAVWWRVVRCPSWFRVWKLCLFEILISLIIYILFLSAGNVSREYSYASGDGLHVGTAGEASFFQVLLNHRLHLFYGNSQIFVFDVCRLFRRISLVMSSLRVVRVTPLQWLEALRISQALFSHVRFLPSWAILCVLMMKTPLGVILPRLSHWFLVMLPFPCTWVTSHKDNCWMELNL